MNGAASRNKGAGGEREFFRLLNVALGHEHFHRNLDQTRNGGADDDPTRHAFPVVVEVKRQEKMALNSWITQASVAAEALGKIPCVAWRPSHAPWRVLVSLSLSQFAAFLQPDTDTESELSGLIRRWR